MEDGREDFFIVWIQYKILKNTKIILFYGRHFSFSQTSKKPQTTNNFNQSKGTQVTFFNNLVPASKAVLTWIYFAFVSGDLPLNIKTLPTVKFLKLFLSSAELTI